MSNRTAIEWTDRTWNPVTGCTPIGAGCDNCYAARGANGRLRNRYLRQAPATRSDAARRDPFAVRVWPERLKQPLAIPEGQKIFLCSMGDLFHRDVPDWFGRLVFEVMLEADWHTYQVLTKRPDRARRFIERNRDLFAGGIPPRNIWLGTSVENQDVVYRVSHLRSVPAAVRFLSCEPLLGPLDLDLDGVHWVIGGGESGPGHRPMDPEWARSVRDQVKAAGLPFFFKQWGGRTTKAGGKELDGRIWVEFPETDDEMAIGTGQASAYASRRRVHEGTEQWN